MGKTNQQVHGGEIHLDKETIESPKENIIGETGDGIANVLDGGNFLALPHLGSTLPIADIAAAFENPEQVREFMGNLVIAAKDNPEMLKSMGDLLSAVEIYTTESGFNNTEELTLRTDVVNSFSLSEFASTKGNDISNLNRDDLFNYWDTIISMSSEERGNRGRDSKSGINEGGVGSANLWPLTWNLAGKMSHTATTEKYGHLAGINGNTPDQVMKALENMTDPVCIFELLMGEAWEDMPDYFLEKMFSSTKLWDDGLAVKTNVVKILSLIISNK